MGATRLGSKALLDRLAQVERQLALSEIRVSDQEQLRAGLILAAMIQRRLSRFSPPCEKRESVTSPQPLAVVHQLCSMGVNGWMPAY
jgi:hypothetical protein